jgi:hypothetical protein
MVGDGGGEVLEAVEVAADGDPEPDTAEVAAHRRHRVGQLRVGEQRVRAAVAGDVAGLGRREVEVDRGDVEAGP